MKLRQLGEDLLLQTLIPTLSVSKRVVAAAGDDVAVVESPDAGNLLLLKTDCVVEKIHFDAKAPPAAVGWKAMMRPLSDFAAVAGIPQFALVTLVVAGGKRSEWVKKLYLGLNRAAARFDVSIVGGETSRTRGPTVISVSVSGFVEKDRWVSRSGGKQGDDLFVTGRLGGANKGRHLRFLPRIEESRWLTERFSIHAMMDLSDGLGADLPRLARASKVSFRLDYEKLPRNRGAEVKNAISDGEDYELLFAVASRDRERLQKAWARKFPTTPLTRIGRLIRRSKAENQVLPRGYVHFQ